MPLHIWVVQSTMLLDQNLNLPTIRNSAIFSAKGSNINLRDTNLSYNSGRSAPRAPTGLRGTQYRLS